MEEREKKKLNMKVQWAKFIVVLVLYLLFLYWVKSWWGLLVVPFIYDVYISKKIKWQWWKDSEGPIRWVMSWVVHQPVLLPELRDPIEFFGEVAADGRLPLRIEGKLWSSHPRNTTDDAVDAAYASSVPV